MSERDDHKVVLPIGPQHPSLKEPGSFKITLDGEKVERAVVEVGYNHRGIEKACESRTYIQDLYIIGARLRHLFPRAYVVLLPGVRGYGGAGSPAPRVLHPRDRRRTGAPAQAICSGWASPRTKIGFDTLFMYTWRDRELVLDMLAQIGGNRINYGVNYLWRRAQGSRSGAHAEHPSRMRPSGRKN